MPPQETLPRLISLHFVWLIYSLPGISIDTWAASKRASWLLLFKLMHVLNKQRENSFHQSTKKQVLLYVALALVFRTTSMQVVYSQLYKLLTIVFLIVDSCFFPLQALAKEKSIFFHSKAHLRLMSECLGSLLFLVPSSDWPTLREVRSLCICFCFGALHAQSLAPKGRG